LAIAGNSIDGMKKFLGFLCIFTPCLIASASAQATVPVTTPQTSNLTVRVELLSDAGGADMAPYLKNLTSDLKSHMLSPTTETANRQLARREETSIVLTIAPDGKLQAMQLESSSHDVLADKTAWSAITATSFSPPPAGTVKLRVHFVAN
jgi:TonB family protein